MLRKYTLPKLHGVWTKAKCLWKEYTCKPLLKEQPQGLGVWGVGCGESNSKNCSNISENLPIKAANFFELDGGKQHFKLNEPNLARETSQGFSQ